MAGLNPEHQSILNNSHLSDSDGQSPSEWERYERLLNDMRGTYAGDPLALEQIDVFDPNSTYSWLRRELVKAQKTGDTEEIDKYESQLAEHNLIITALRRSIIEEAKKRGEI